MQLVMLQGVRFWPELITAVGRADLATDERFTSPEALFANREEGTRVLDEIFATRTYDEWKDVLADVKGVWAPVQTGLDLHDDVQVQANGYLGDAVSVQGAPFQLVTEPDAVQRGAHHDHAERPSSASTPTTSCAASVSTTRRSSSSRSTNAIL